MNASTPGVQFPTPEIARASAWELRLGDWKLLRLLREIAREAIVGLLRNRMRAGLSMLGISWGIVSVVMLLAYGEGFNQALLRGFQGAFGDGVSVMWPGQTSM
jgi:hypothetical protein